jgi:hypothetical protein
LPLRHEPIRVHNRRIAIIVPDRRHRDDTVLRHPPLAGLVHQEAENPRLQRRSTFKPRNAREHRQPGVLSNLLGHGVRCHSRSSQPHKRGVVPLHKVTESTFVAGAQNGNDRLLVDLGWSRPAALATPSTAMAMRLMPHRPANMVLDKHGPR